VDASELLNLLPVDFLDLLPGEKDWFLFQELSAEKRQDGLFG
jgi:hypothetical protein